MKTGTTSTTATTPPPGYDPRRNYATDQRVTQEQVENGTADVQELTAAEYAYELANEKARRTPGAW
jgi:hypothetical protein